MDIELIIKRLKDLGYKYDETADGWVIKSFLIPKITNHIKNETNQSSIPEELLYVAIDMVCGEFLFAKKNSGQFGIDVEAVEKELKRIREGDVEYEYVDTEGSQSNDAKLDALFYYLINGHKGEILSFRKLRW